MKAFLKESFSIGATQRPVTRKVVQATDRFLALRMLSTADIIDLVEVYEPNARLRSHADMLMAPTCFKHPPGGAEILRSLEEILLNEFHPWTAFVRYIILHPFTDGNGVSGRTLWAWKMLQQGTKPESFLHEFYYQTFESKRILLP